MASATANAPQQKLAFTHDRLVRRIRKQVWNNTAGTGTAATDIKFLYEGWNLIAELHALNSNANIRSYLWGNDMSGSRQGAGGVGGLLAEKDSTGVAHLPVFDGNGNVARLITGDAGTTSASYEYGPFGETIRASGSYAASNPIRFSTKYRDAETELYCYGHRYYTPSTGRWLSRDPLAEHAFFNQFTAMKSRKERRKLSFQAMGPEYAVLSNEAISHIDPLGLADWVLPPSKPYYPIPPKKPKEEKCCDPKAPSELRKQAMGDVLKWMEELASELDEAKVAELMKKINFSLFAVDAYNSICSAKNPEGCDDFLREQDLTSCLICCNSIHEAFHPVVAGIARNTTCAEACGRLQ